MGILDFKKPKYRHKDPAIRLAAIGEIAPSETGILSELATNDPDQRVRHAAIARLADPETIDRLREIVAPEDLPPVTARREQLLYELVIDDSDPDRCRKNLREISSPQILAEIVVNHEQPDIRCAAVEMIDDQQILADILEQNCGKEPARAALAKITSEELLRRVSEKGAARTSRQSAAARLSEIEQQRNQPSRDQIIRQTLTDLAKEGNDLFSSVDIDGAAARLEEIKKKWLELDPEGNHSDYPAFKKTCADFTGKLLEVEERRAEERDKAARHEQLQSGLEEICATIERLTGSTEPGSGTEKERVVALWHSMIKNAAGKAVPTAAMTKRFATACRSFDKTAAKVEQEREQFEDVSRDFQGAKKLIDEGALKKAEKLLAEAETKLSAIKFKYFSRTSVEELRTETAEQLKNRKTALYSENLQHRREITEELQNLASHLDSRTEQRFENLRRRWQEVEKLDGPEAEELAKLFEKGSAELAEKLQNFKEEKDWQLWANLTLKEKLTEMVEGLEQEDDLATVFETVQKAQAEWKEVGPIPQKKSQPLWERFHSACNRHFARTEPYLEERKVQREAAMERRREICALAKELAESKEWQKTTEIFRKLQNEWKELPPGPRNEEKKLYKQFRQACDLFFEHRQEDYRQKEEERRQHLLEKEKLCEEAERLAADPQPDYVKNLRDLQAEWKKIGPVPKKKSEKIWERFRTACDRYFEWLDGERLANLARKEELCLEAEKLIAGAGEEASHGEIAARLTDLQTRWKEIGPAPRSQNEAVWQRFHETCDTFFKARHKQLEEDKGKRLLNQARKEELLAEAEDLAERENDKTTAAALQRLQKDWTATGNADREIDQGLNERFKALCDAFFEGRRQFFAELKERQFENQKEKEKLCLRLENITGTASLSVEDARDKALSLADQLKQAMEDNFMLAGRRDEKKEVHEEVKRIEQEWRKIGPVPRNQIKPLAARYKRALDQYYQSRRN